jgi:hypothetical protein
MAQHSKSLKAIHVEDNAFSTSAALDRERISIGQFGSPKKVLATDRFWREAAVRRGLGLRMPKAIPKLICDQSWELQYSADLLDKNQRCCATPAPYTSQCFPAIQSRICVDATVFFGLWGFKVPAIALQPSLIICSANCFASASVLNLRVARTDWRSAPSRLGVMLVR